MIRLIIWAVLLIVIGRIVWRFMYAIFDGAGMLKGPGQRERTAVKLVRDPICGVFVVPGKALDLGIGHRDPLLLFGEMPRPVGPAVSSEAELRADIVEVGRRLYARGYTASNDGNISVRLGPDRLLMTPTSVCKGFMTVEMMCITDLDGKKVAGERNPSSEMQMHLEVYRRRPDVNAVVHAHPPIATGFAVAGIPLDRAVLAEVV